jgi:uncharacterized RDD family membrane protein YckC
MISATMAVTTAVTEVAVRAEFAREARLFRFFALLLDLLVLSAITFIVNSVYGLTQPTQGLVIAGGPYSTTVAWPWLTLVAILYFAVPEAMFGATPGKAWARVRVVRLDGRPLGFGSVVIRNLLKPIDFLPLLYLLGGLLVLLSGGSQRLGDIAAGTTVVYRHRALEPGATRSSTSTTRKVLVGTLVFAVLFTLAFDYLGRPSLVIEGMYNEQFGPMHGVRSYELGQPEWSLGQVTYPIRLIEQLGGPTGVYDVCSGSITLDWGWLGGWTAGASGWSCAG